MCLQLFLEIINSIRDWAQGGEEYKDYVFVQVVEKDIENLIKE